MVCNTTERSGTLEFCYDHVTEDYPGAQPDLTAHDNTTISNSWESRKLNKA